MKNFFIKFSFLILSTFILDTANAGKILDELVEKVKPAVVTIRFHESTAAYGGPESSEGTGFVVDKEKGIIVTNRHIASINNPAAYEATFFGGSTADLRLIWNDPIHDFSFLKIDPKKIPENVPHIEFSRQAKINQDVFIIGNNEGMSHSKQEGAIHDLFHTAEVGWLLQAYSVNFNTRGGSSGSPIFNDVGEVVSINYGGSATTDFSVPISYVQDALEYILKDKIPPRFSTGALFHTVNLDTAQDYCHYSIGNAKQKLEQIEGARSRLLQVKSHLTLLGQVLEVDDIIEEVNGIFVGPNQYLLNKILNQSEGKPVKFKVSRNGQLFDLDVPTFNLNEAVCSKMLVFGNAVFSTVDPQMSLETGMPMNRVCIASASSGTIFDKLPKESCGMGQQPRALVERMNGKQVNNPNDLIEVLPEIIKLRKFSFIFKNHANSFGMTDSVNNRSAASLLINYNPELYSKPYTMSFDHERNSWVREELNFEEKS